MKKAKPFSQIDNPRDIRKKLKINQTEFWNQVGVTQSGGSRYESGRAIPNAVRELVRIVHIEGVPLEQITRKNFKQASK